MDDASRDGGQCEAQLQALKQELCLLQSDLAAAGLPIEAIADVASPAGVRCLREVLCRQLTLVEAQIAEHTTELTQTNQALRESEEKFRTVTEASPACIYVIQDGCYVFANEAAFKSTGYSRDEILGRPFTDLVHPDFRARMVAYAEAYLTGKSAPERYEMQFLTKYGECRWGDFIPRAITFDGRPAILVIVFDITERKQADEALKISERRFHELAELAPVGIFLGDAYGNVTYVNQRWSEITGWPQEQGMGLGWMAGIYPDDRAYVIQGQERSFFEKKEVRLEYRYLTPDHILKWIVVNVRPLLDAQGTLTAFIGTVLDITENKKAEARVQQLLRSVEQWAAEMDATITAIADGVIINGPDIEVIRINRAAEEILGYTPELETLPFRERFTHLKVELPDGRRLTLEEMPPSRALRGETIHNMVLAFTPTGKTTRWVSLSAAPIPASDGTILGAVSTLSDITALRELQQRQEDLLHIVSHDLRVPLTVIHGHIQLIEEALNSRGIDGGLALSTSTIERNTRRMNLMIQDLVDMARLEGHQFTLQLKDIMLQTYIPDLLTRLRDILPMHRVSTDLPPDLPPARADYDRLERILLNLLTNAFKYSAAETPVHIRAVQHGNEILIAISDQGCGIAPKDLPHLFQRFFRVEGERKAEGLGLGLYITKLLVEAQGGHIWVESVVGQGSTFSFTLPVAGE